MELERYGIIYKITNTISNKIYIGQTTRKNGFNGRYTASGKGIERVYGTYKCNIKYGEMYNKHLFRSMNKNGLENFEVIEDFVIAYSKQELDEKEIFWINFYKSDDWKYGYNIKKGGDRGSYSKQAYFQYAINRNFINPIIVDDTGEVFVTLQQAEREMKKTEHHFNFRYLNEIDKIPVVCINTSEIFISGVYASKTYSISRSSIDRCCKGKLKSAGKHPITGEKMIWKYLSDVINNEKTA